MVFGVYFASGSSLFTFVAIPTPPTTSSRADAMKNRVRRVLRIVLAARESLSFRTRMSMNSTSAKSSTRMAR